MFPQKIKVEVHSHDDQVVGKVKLAIRVVVGVMPMIRQTVVRLMVIVDLRQDTLIAEMTGRKVSVTATKAGVMRIGSRVTPLGSRGTPPGSSGVAGALAVTWDPRNMWLRALVVAPLVGA